MHTCHELSEDIKLKLEGLNLVKATLAIKFGDEKISETSEIDLCKLVAEIIDENNKLKKINY